MAEAGANVVLLARTLDELEATAAQIRAAGGGAAVVQADLGDLAGIEAIARRAGAEFGPIDILVNNAAVVWPLGSATAVDPGAWAAAIGINVTAVAVLTFALLPVMLERGWGRIVNVSSGIAARPEAMIGANAYATSKAALEAHTVNLAAELANSGVTVNAYRPGAVDTAMQAWIRDQDPAEIGTELHERFNRSYTAGTLLTAEDSARVLVTRILGEGTGRIWDVSDAG